MTPAGDLNQPTEDSYTFSLAVEPSPFGLSVAERSRRPSALRHRRSSTSPLARLRSERTASVFSKSSAVYQCPVVRFRKLACTVLQTSGGSDPFAEFNNSH